MYYLEIFGLFSSISQTSLQIIAQSSACTTYNFFANKKHLSKKQTAKTYLSLKKLFWYKIVNLLVPHVTNGHQKNNPW